MACFVFTPYISSAKLLRCRCATPAAKHRTVFVQRPSVGRSIHAAAAKVEPAVDVTAEKGVRCFMTEEGALVCERLTPGNYRLESAAPREHGDGNAPRCDPANPKSCLTYVYVLESGTMVCEGLPSGEYEIKEAQPEDVDRMLEHATRLSQGLPATAPAKEAEAKPEGGWLGKLTGFLRQT